jgi:hypothetical protein
MMLDPVTLKQLNDITIQERLEEAEKNRLLNEIAASDRASLEFVVNRVSGWMQRVKPTASIRPAATYGANVEQKLATAEIPGV